MKRQKMKIKFGLFLTCLMMVCVSAMSQNRIVKGTVNDNEGQPLPGATILLKGTSKGTATDLNGNFSIEVPGEPFAYTVSNFFDGYIISSIVEKPEGYMWVGTYSNFFVYDISKKEWLEMTNNQAIITQLLDSGEENMLWGSTWDDGLLKIRWEKNRINSPTVEQYLSDFKNIYRIFPVNDNKLLLGTWGGGIKTVQYTDQTVEERPPYCPIEAPVIRCFFRDNYDRLWVGTYGNELYQLDVEENGMNKFSPVYGNGVSAVATMCEFGKNHLLIGTQGDGLHLMDIKTQQLISKPIVGDNSLFDNYILSLYLDDDILIVGHDGYGINYAVFNDERKTNFSLKRFIENGLSKITSIYKGNDGRFWLGTKQSGIMSVRLNTQTGRFTDLKRYDLLRRDEVTGFVEFGNDRLWVSSHSGLYLFDTKANRMVENQQAIISDMVYSMVDDSKNKCLWLGTSIGLRKLDYSETYEIKQVLPPELLPEGAILDISLDEDNNLWFSISNRIFCFLDKEQKLKEINPEFFGNQILLSLTQATVNGKRNIIFGGTEYLLCIEPHKILNQPEQTKIVCTELQIDHRKVNVGDEVYGQIVLHETPEYISSITLSYLCKWISLSFTEVGWDYYRNKYQYRVEGFSNDWQYMDVTKPLTFSQLPPGDYTLFIRRYGADKMLPYWSMRITINPPWWQTYWFYGVLIAMFLVLSGISAWSIRNYYRKRQHQRVLEIEKKKKEELVQEKESFLAGLSHDLLTPFSLIISPINDLLRKKNLPEEDLEKLDIVSRHASFLSDIFSTMFDFKRVEMMDIEVHEKNVELVSFVKMIVHAFEYLAQSRKINLSFQSNISELTISVDTVKLERIIYNILSNSIKFTPENGSVAVSLVFDNLHYTISVNDTGIGIDTRYLVKVFDKFYQVRGYKKEKTNGLGLGLYIVRKFVLILGGNVYIDSKLGSGTTIHIDLPAKPVDKTIITETRNETDTLPSILLVEDHHQLRNYLHKEFSRYFQVTTVPNGVLAFDFIKNNYPEIVISDIMMPEMDGLELCSAIKRTPMLSDIFVVLFSAKSTTEDELQGYKAGADFYVKKPFDAEVLIKQVLNVYQTRQHRKKQIINEILTTPQSEETETVPKNDFLHKAIRIIEKHLMDENYKTDDFAAEMNLSKPVLYRKFKVMIGETPNIFIRNVRLQKAANMLKNTELSVTEIAYLTGFGQAHYFIKCFKEMFGKTPKNYQKMLDET